MATLVIVESPAKAGTVANYLSKNNPTESYKVLSCFGHVRDLVPKTGAVEPDNDFLMHYQVIERNEKHVKAIIHALKQADTLLLATDPDREGEAISWHLYELLKEKKKLKDKKVARVVFHQITQKALEEAMNQPRDLAMNLVDAQQARRGLDYLVGFNLSPLLWKKVRRGLSAGRVQSPALRLICEREAAIDAFKKQEYWSLEAICQAESEPKPFHAKCVTYDGAPVKQFTWTDKATMDQVSAAIIKAAQGQLKVNSVKKSARKRQPFPPFMTSTLQQEAVKKLGFSAAKAMRVAQQLYEGIDLGKAGKVGLITYMRTDSLHLASEAVASIRQVIQTVYGQDYLPAKARVYKSKQKNAQEAHEAIRPTDASRQPSQLKGCLDQDQFKLYQMIWARTVASQMQEALFDTVRIELAAGDVAIFRANGSVLKFPGFLSAYQEGKDEDMVKSPSDEQGLLPDLKTGQSLSLADLKAQQHFTEPPPRFTEASLVKALEEYGIGRPSTYASIIATLVQREYVQMDKKRFVPTDVGRTVSSFLTNHFEAYVNYKFTARMEDDLDAIARGEKPWKTILRQFWQGFFDQIAKVDDSVKRSDVTQELLDEACPECSKPLSSRLGRMGRFIGCTGYPECRYTRNVVAEGEEGDTAQPEAEKLDRPCPKCKSDLVYKQGRYGRFIGCSAYPECRHIESLNKPKALDIDCPMCKKNKILERKSRYGKIFYGCAGYPSCKYALWYQPIAQACPTCHWPILMKKETKRRGKELVCAKEGCSFSKSLDDASE